MFLCSDPGKLVLIKRKQCELMASMGDINGCIDTAKSLLQMGDKEATLFTLKLLSPLTSRIDPGTLEMVQRID